MLRVQSGEEKFRNSVGEYFDKLLSKSSIALDKFSDFKVARAGTEPLEKKVHIKKPERVAPLKSNETCTLLPKGANVTGARVFGFKKSTVQGELGHLSKLALQMVLSGIIDFIPGFFSGVLTGHLSNKLSSQLIAARSLSGIFMMITGYTVNIAIGAAMDTLCAQAYGAGKLYEMGIFFQTGIIIFAVCFIPVSIISYFCVDILVLLGQPEEIAVLARSLVLWSLPNLPFGIINGLLCKILQGQNIIIPMVWAGVAGMIVHNFLIWYLMFHTSVGYVASSIATSALGAIYTIVLCVYFFTSHLYQKEWPGWRIRDALKEIPEFIKLGVSGLMMFIFEYWGFAAVSLFAGMLPYASVAMSADSTYSSFRVLCAIFYYSISVAGSVRVGNALGANEPERAKVAAYTSVALTASCALATSFVMAMSRDVYPYAYSEDPNVVRLTSRLMLLTCPFQVFAGITSAIQGIFRGSGLQDLGARLNFVAFLVIAVPIGLTLAYQFYMGLIGLWLGLCCGFVCSALYGLYWLSTANWHELALEAQKRTRDPSEISPQTTSAC